MGNRHIQQIKIAQEQKQASGTDAFANNTGNTNAPAAEAKAFLEELEVSRKVWREAALAFLQGTHSRLGASSLVSQLPVDVLSQIVFLFRPTVPLVATCCPAGVVRVWELSYTRIVHTFSANENSYFVKLTDQEVICGLQRGIEAWDLWEGARRPADRVPNVPGTVWAVDTRGNTLACAHTDRTITMWDLKNERPGRGPASCSEWIHSILVYDSDTVLTGLRNGEVEVWSTTAAGTCALARVRKLERHKEAVTCMQSLSGGRVLTGSYDGTVKMWDLSNGSCIRTFAGHTQGILSLCARGDLLVTGGGDGVRTWTLSTGEEGRIFVHEEALCVAILDDARIVSGGADSLIKIWDADTGSEITTLQNHGQVFFMQVVYV